MPMPTAAPITVLRLSSGAVETSQVSPAAHRQEPPAPWTKRAASSTTRSLREAEGHARRRRAGRRR